MYWLALSVPVFLFLIYTKKEAVYWTDAKRALRKEDPYGSSTVHLTVPQGSSLSSAKAQSLLTLFVLLAEGEATVLADIVRLFSEFRDFHEFVSSHTDLDFFMPAEDDECRRFIEIWNTVSRVREYFLIQQPTLHPLSHWIEQGQRAFGNAYEIYFERLRSPF